MESRTIKLWLNTTIVNVNEDGDGDGNGDEVGNGNGYGSGSGSGNGDGNGYGVGNGNGYGSGSGNGDGNGYGDGSGYETGNNISSFNNHLVFIIDSVQTIIVNIRNNVASGFIINKDLSLTPCYIAKEQNTFSHGTTIREAVKNLQNKLTLTKPIEEKIKDFKNKFNSYTKKYKAFDLYNWHYLLTGSCELGRKNFCSNNNIDLEKDKFTIKEFINLTKKSYNNDIIKKLEDYYINN